MALEIPRRSTNEKCRGCAPTTGVMGFGLVVSHTNESGSNTRWYDGLLLAKGRGPAPVAAVACADGGRQPVHRSSIVRVLDSVFSGPIGRLRPPLCRMVFFTLAMVAVHALFGAGLLGDCSRLSMRAWPTLKATPNQHLCALVRGGYHCLLAHNAAVFSTSSLGQPYAPVMTKPSSACHWVNGCGSARWRPRPSPWPSPCSAGGMRAAGFPANGFRSWPSHALPGSGSRPSRVTTPCRRPARTTQCDPDRARLAARRSRRRSVFAPCHSARGSVHERRNALHQRPDAAGPHLPFNARHAHRPASHSSGAIMNLLPRKPASTIPNPCRACCRAPVIRPCLQWMKCDSRTSTRVMDSSRPSPRPSVPPSS